MTPELGSAHAEANQHQSSIVFDAGSVALLGRFGDELTAYRTKKSWVELLSSHFLLEPKRDYEMKVDRSAESAYPFTLTCSFTSACGRYAFWRLINHQAPDAEVRLYRTIYGKAMGRENIDVPRTNSDRTKVPGEQLPWVIAGLGSEPEVKRERTPTAVAKLLTELAKQLRTFI